MYANRVIIKYKWYIMITKNSCDTFHIPPKHTCTTFAYLKLPITNNFYKIIILFNVRYLYFYKYYDVQKNGWLFG